MFVRPRFIALPSTASKTGADDDLDAYNEAISSIGVDADWSATDDTTSTMFAKTSTALRTLRIELTLESLRHHIGEPPTLLTGLAAKLPSSKTDITISGISELSIPYDRDDPHATLEHIQDLVHTVPQQAIDLAAAQGYGENPSAFLGRVGRTRTEMAQSDGRAAALAARIPQFCERTVLPISSGAHLVHISIRPLIKKVDKKGLPIREHQSPTTALHHLAFASRLADLFDDLWGPTPS